MKISLNWEVITTIKQLAPLGFVFYLYSDDELATGRPKAKR